MSIFGADYESADSLEIMEDLDMNENRIRDPRNPRDVNDAVNKRYMNKRIEYKTKDLENKLTTIQTQITNIQQQHENDVVTAKFLYDYAKIADKKYMKTNEEIDMQKHRIKGLGNPLEIDDAVTLQYVASRKEGLTAEIEKLREGRI